MAINSITSSFITDGILGTGAGRHVAHAVPSLRREAAPWPWPLPVNSVFAVFDDPAASNAIDRLRDTIADQTEIWMLSGEDGARQLRDTFRQRGLLTRLRSLIGDEGEIAAQLEAWATCGATVILIRPPQDRLDAAVNILARAQPRLLRRTSRWLSTWTAWPSSQAPSAAVNGG